MTTEINVERGLFDEVMVPLLQPDGIHPSEKGRLTVWDQQGNEYIDFAGGIAVSCLGHCHPALVNALTEQGNKLWH